MSATPVTICTVVARNYVSYARVLGRSLREHAPGLPYVVLLIDEPDAPFDPRVEPFSVAVLEDLGIPNLRSFCFRLDRRELASLVKPFLLARVLERGAGAAIFLDPDVLAVGDLAPVVEHVVRHPVTVTPHLLVPPAGERAVERELNIVLSGTLNAGFVAVARSATADRFLEWWKDRVAGACSHAVGDGIFYDQRWLDLAPGLFPDVQIVRDPGWNIAYWNLRERDVRASGDSVVVNGCPARFFHFSGFVPGEWHRLSRYSRWATASDVGDAAAVFERFDRLLAEAGHAATRSWPYAFERFDNGVAIPGIVRRIHAEFGDAAGGWGDPFAASSPHSFFRWLTTPAGDGCSRGLTVSRLWDAIYRRRGDLQRALPDVQGKDGPAFRRWVETFGKAEYDMPDELIR